MSLATIRPADPTATAGFPGYRAQPAGYVQHRPPRLQVRLADKHPGPRLEQLVQHEPLVCKPAMDGVDGMGIRCSGEPGYPEGVPF